MNVRIPRKLIPILFLFFSVPVSAQFAQIQSLSIQPVNPSPQDTISVHTQAQFGSSSCALSSQQINVGTDTVIISSYHQQGMLPTICTSNDVSDINPLSPGVYHLVYQITDQSYTQVHDFDTLTFTVGCPDPVAGFSDTASNDTTVSFNNTAQFADSTLWVFGDGDSSTVKNPVHQYPDTGTYQVCQYVMSSCGADTLCQNVQAVCSAPQTAFAHTSANYEISFSNQTSGAYSYYWEFGDGSDTTTENPVHTYADTGNYQVCLITTNDCGSDTLCQNITVTCDKPQTNFFYTSNNKEVYFFNQSVADDSLYWDFDDGTDTTAENPQHTFPDTGDYEVCLIASNACGSDTLCQTVSVTCPLPQSGFTYNKDSLQVDFSDTSQNADSLLWQYGDTNTATVQNPQHIYSEPGTYEVCLIAYNECGSDTTCQNITVTCPLPVPDFTHATDSLEASFTNQSQDAQSYLWEFGDGNQSTDSDPVHNYDSAGTYTVCLYAENACGTDSTCQSVEIICPVPDADFSFNQDGLSVDFSTSTSEADTYQWDFGDGNTASGSQTSHQYSAQNTYTVCLTAANSCGSAAECKEVDVLISSVNERNNLFSEARFYPNPVHDKVLFEAGIFTDEIEEIQIRSMSGAVLRSERVTGPQTKIDMASLSSGAYAAVIIGRDGSRTVRTLIKQ